MISPENKTLSGAADSSLRAPTHTVINAEKTGSKRDFFLSDIFKPLKVPQIRISSSCLQFNVYYHWITLTSEDSSAQSHFYWSDFKKTWFKEIRFSIRNIQNYLKGGLVRYWRSILIVCNELMQENKCVFGWCRPLETVQSCVKSKKAQLTGYRNSDLVCVLHIERDGLTWLI